MKNLYQKIKNVGKGLVVAGGLAVLLSGCVPEPVKNKKDLITIKGEPLSCVVVGQDIYNWGISLVLESEGNYIPAVRDGGRGSRYLKAAAAIKSEINDKDNEPITIIGKYCDGGNYSAGKYFKIKAIEANGIKVDLGPI